MELGQHQVLGFRPLRLAAMVEGFTSRRLVALACAVAASAAAAGAADRTVVVADGAVKLGMTRPDPQALSSAASVDLQLPAGTMRAEATAAVGREGNDPAFWQKNAAQIGADLSGPLGTNLNLSGQDSFGFTYRAPASVGASDTASHMVRSENRGASASLSVPVGPAKLTLGGEGSAAATQDTAKGLTAGERAIVRTEDRSFFAKAEWQPLPNINLEGGAAARTSDISWREQHAKTSTFQSLDPHLAVHVNPWEGGSVTARVEHKVAPYDAGAFAGYAAANPNATAAAFEPNHAWQVQMQMEQKIGSASLSASYTAASRGTATEFADQNGVQSPSSTPLKKQENVAVALTLPLTGFGLPNTNLSSQAEWQNSRVVDPVTAKLRGVSGEVPAKLSLRMAHKLPKEKLSFGLTGEFTGGRTSYQVNEISSTESGGSLGAFMSYKPGNYELDLNVNGLYGATTQNSYFLGARDSSKIGRTVFQDNSGPLVNLSLHKPL